MKKNYQIVSKTLIIALVFMIQGVLLAQNANRNESSDKLVYQWYINLNGGLTHSFCDIQSGEWPGSMTINSFGESNQQGYAGGIRLGKHISPVFGIYGAFNYGSLKGSSGVDTKNMYFETSPLMDYYLGTTVSFSNLLFGYKPRLVNIYGTVGIGLSTFTPQAYNLDTGAEITPDKNDPNADWSNTTEAMVPTGIGVDFRINDRWDINFETTIRWFDSDKLDGYKSGEKNDAYYFTTLGLGYSFWQPKGCDIRIETEPTILVLHGDSIPIEVKGTFPECFNEKGVVDFTPVLKYGDKSLPLETMYFQGEEVPTEFQKQGAVIMPVAGGSFTYKTFVKYEPGMEVCELYVDPMVSIKGNKPYSLSDRKIADGLIMTSKRLNNVEKLLLADHGYKRDIIVSEMGIIYYVVNRYDLNLNYKLNKDAQATEGLAKMNSFIAKGWEMKDIDINAWASPEGEESLNQGLSEKRSETGQKYVQSEYQKYIKDLAKKLGKKPEELQKEIKFNLKANGEDWDGFMKSIQSSEIKDKNIIANVVNSQSDPTKREQEIRNMTVIYKEIEEDILPPLRRAEIKVNCYEPSLTDQEIAQYATSSPDSLTISEMLYAATLTTDANAKLNIYKTVIQKYPNDWRGYNNAGYASSELGDYDGASTYFAKAKSMAANNGMVLNNTGAMASKDKDFDKAKADYMAAQKQGVDVNYNMGIVKIADGNYNGAINSFGSVKCDYNLALAHVLSGNYNAATSTLNCAEKTPEVYYLQAIIGARTSNDSMVFENLKKAISGDATYRETAKEDREFLKYYSNADFQNAIK
jgi:tetratricopeptide (TPR) repeat protein